MLLSTYKKVKETFAVVRQVSIMSTPHWGEYLGLFLESFEESGEKFSCVLHGSPLTVTEHLC